MHKKTNDKSCTFQTQKLQTDVEITVKVSAKGNTLNSYTKCTLLEFTINRW